jgi:hypothetical protein
VGILEDRLRAATGGGAHLPNWGGQGSPIQKSAERFVESEHPRDADGKFRAVSEALSRLGGRGGPPGPGDLVEVHDPASSVRGATAARVIGPSKTSPATHTVVEAAGTREAVANRFLKPSRHGKTTEVFHTAPRGSRAFIKRNGVTGAADDPDSGVYAFRTLPEAEEYAADPQEPRDVYALRVQRARLRPMEHFVVHDGRVPPDKVERIH